MLKIIMLLVSVEVVGMRPSSRPMFLLYCVSYKYVMTSRCRYAYTLVHCPTSNPHYFAAELFSHSDSDLADSSAAHFVKSISVLSPVALARIKDSDISPIPP